MKRALIVEDDPDIAEPLVRYLAGDAWTVDATDDGRKALERLQREGYQLLILDLQLPGLDGLQVCAEVRRDQRTRDIPVIMLTARSEESDRITSISACRITSPSIGPAGAASR